MNWLFGKKTEKRKQQENILRAAIESSSALELAAKGTANLAEDVTRTLQHKIDDYAEQIEQTARLLADALIVVDDTGNIESFNPAAEAMFGYPKRSMKTKSISMLFDTPITTCDPVTPNCMAKFSDAVNDDDASATVHYEDFMGVRQDGSKFFLDVSASKITRNNKNTFYIILIRDVSHQVQNSNMLKELATRNHELLTTIDASSTGFIILSPNGSDFKISFVNEGFSKLLGHSCEEIRSMTLMDLLGVERTFWTIRKSLHENVETRHEAQLDIGKCQSLWFDVQITPVFRANHIHQWILVFYDTTALKKAFHDLRKSESHFRAFSDASSESMLIHNNNTLIDWNDRLNHLTGYSDDEIEKLKPLDLVHPLERDKIRDNIDMLTSDSSYETLFMTKKGDVREVAVNSRSIEWDNAQAQIAIVRDVTEFKDIETQLKTARERYRTVVDNTIDLVICFNNNLEITFSNQTFRDYFDVELEEINGFPLLEIIPESDHDKFKTYMLGMTPETTVRRGVHRIIRHGEIRMQDWIDRGIFDDEGNLIEIQSIVRDITNLLPPE